MSLTINAIAVSAPQATQDAIRDEFHTIDPADYEQIQFRHVEPDIAVYLRRENVREFDAFLDENDLEYAAQETRTVSDLTLVPTAVRGPSQDIYEVANQQGPLLDIIDTIAPDEDQRKYIYEGMGGIPQAIPFKVGASLGPRAVYGYEPIAIDTIRQLIDIGLTPDDEDSRYPNASDIVKWGEEFVEVFPDGEMYGTGYFYLPRADDPDGCAVFTGICAAPASDETEAWFDERFSDHSVDSGELNEVVANNDDYLLADDLSRYDQVETFPEGVISVWID